MFKFILLVTFLLAIGNVPLCECIRCPDKNPMAGLDMEKFFGAWYAVQTSNGIESCEIFKIKQGTSSSNFILNTETRLNTNDEQFKTLLTETLETIDTDQPGKMRVSPVPRMTSMVSYKFGHVVASNFTIIKTDYETYAIVYRSDGYIYNSFMENENTYSCYRSTQFWSRTPALSDSFIQKIQSIQNSIDPIDMMLINMYESKNKTGCVTKEDEKKEEKIDIFVISED